MRSLVLLFAVFGGAAAVSARTSRGGLSPVTRVVELLKGLSAQVEKEGKAEEDLYETFVCWGESIVKQKKASNAAAAIRIGTLETYISDLDAGRIELTTERVDLEKTIAELNADIEAATEVRDKEASDYAEASNEMQQAIDALTDALDVLRTATKNHTEGVLLTMRSRLGSGARANAERKALTRAVELGEKFLSKGDALFLKRLMTGEVPNVDWKKLNRKATFKSKYKARSFKIQDVLTEMLETFSTNLDDAQKKEGKAIEVYDKLMTAKKGQRETAQEALENMDSEQGAKGLSRSEAVDEKDDLTTQVENDEKYIGEVQDALKNKKEEWVERKSVRMDEVAAISKCIQILSNDEARDLMKRSMTSQGYMFLQESKSQSMSMLKRLAVSAASELRRAYKAQAAKDRDHRLNALAVRLAAADPLDINSNGLNTTHFVDVVKAIDDMLDILKSEETSDLNKKETCESDRATNTRNAIKYSREIDEMTEKMESLQGEVEEIMAEIKDKEGGIANINEELKEAEKVRGDENKEYLKAKQDDEDAKKTVEDAKEALTEFYADTSALDLAQVKKQPVSEAGKAPPPPPTTWDEPYGGKQGEADGVVAILKLIIEDIAKDLAKAKKDEDDAANLYEETKEALELERDNLDSAIEELNGTKSTKEDKKTEIKGDRNSKKGDLDLALNTIHDFYPGCSFFEVNFENRVKNRQIEIDGLLKAKAILSGATFTPEDPNREIKPGDALLLRLRANLHHKW